MKTLPISPNGATAREPRALIGRRQLLAAGALPLLGAAGCSNRSDGRITLTVGMFPDLDRGARLAVPTFQRMRPDVDVKITALAIADHHTAMTAGLATGANLPDVMAIDVDYIGRFNEASGLVDLAKTFGADAQRHRVSSFAMAAASARDGRISAMPVDIGPGALFYRADLLEKAGLQESDLTTSWETFLESGRRLKERAGVYLLSTADDIKNLVIRTGLKAGEGIYFDAEGQPTVESPRFVKAFELALAARRSGIDARVGSWSSEWAEGLRRGRMATQMMGAWFAGHLKNWVAPDSAGLWRSAPLPNGTFASWGGSFYAIPRRAAQPELAWEFIRLVTLDKAQQLAAFKLMDAFPALIEAQQDPIMDEPIQFLGGQLARHQWRDAAKQIPPLRADRFDGMAFEIVRSELSSVLESGKAIPQALSDARRAILRRVRR
jgi:multiple sugar transport system substrate-binding protein